MWVPREAPVRAFASSSVPGGCRGAAAPLDGGSSLKACGNNRSGVVGGEGGVLRSVALGAWCYLLGGEGRGEGRVCRAGGG